jgi:pyruvate-formate lyase-activating enzyme
VPATVNTANFKIRCDRAGVHAFDRSSGLNILLDKVIVPQSEWAAAPRHLAVALTNACDLHCAYCYAPKHRAVLDPGRVLGWLHEADSAGCLGVGFGGGEPTTLQWFAELCRRTARETSLAVSFTTHGHRLTDDLLDELVGNVHFVRVSVDGTGEIYEQQRGRPFDMLVDRLKALAEASAFGINVVVNEETVDDLDAIVRLAEMTGAAELLLLPQLATAVVPATSRATAERLRAWVGRYRGAVRLAVSEHGAAELPVAEPFGDQPSIERYAHIDASGVLRPTSFSPRGIEIGEGSFVNTYRRLEREEQQS